MAGLPSYVQTPPTPSANVARYLELQQHLFRDMMKMPQNEVNATFDQLKQLDETIQKDPKQAYQLRANAAHNMAKDLKAQLESGTWMDQPLTPEQRKGIEQSLRKLEHGQMPTKGGSIDIKSGDLIAEPMTPMDIQKLRREVRAEKETIKQQFGP